MLLSEFIFGRCSESGFQAQKSRLSAVIDIARTALILLFFYSLSPGAGLEPAQP